jgi:O-succinylbenzoic acid--CoA ligase
LPLAHIGGLAVVARALLTGVPVTVQAGFDAAEVEAAARAGGATLVSLVPTALARIDAALFRAIVLGGSAPPAVLPPNVHVTYGLTETGSGCVYDGVPLDGVEIALDASNQILVRAAMLLRAYRGIVTDAPSAGGFERDPRDGEGWFATGDIGAIDANGRLHVQGRSDDMIITGGENVWPESIELAIARHPSVAECAVIGADDPEWGQRVVAVVVPAPGARPPSLEELRACVKESLPAYCAPRELVLATTLPRTALGKLQRSLLR